MMDREKIIEIIRNRIGDHELGEEVFNRLLCDGRIPWREGKGLVLLADTDECYAVATQAAEEAQWS